VTKRGENKLVKINNELVEKYSRRNLAKEFTNLLDRIIKTR